MYNLYLVKYRAGTFIGVAKTYEEAVRYFGLKADISLINEERLIVEMMLADNPARVILAIN